MEKVCGIYKIVNLINNKMYIGQSSDIYKRWKEHKKNLRRNLHVNKCLQAAVNKYGLENFRFDIIETCDSAMLNSKEIELIEKYNTFAPQGYNLTRGGEGNRGWHPNREYFKHLYFPVICLNNMRQYECMTDAGNDVGINSQAIAKCCRGETHYSGVIDGQRGVWMFLDEFINLNLSEEQIKEKIDKAQHFERSTPGIRTVVCLNTGEKFIGLILFSN